MIKILGIISIIISSTLIGIVGSEKLRNRVKELNLINYMLEEIAILIRYKAMTVYEIVETLTQNQIFNKLTFLNNFNSNLQIPFKSTWNKNIDDMPTSLIESDVKLLKSFGASLGTSDIDGQLSTIGVFKESFFKLEKDATVIYDKKSKLYRSLGVLIGAFISIILI